MKKNFSLFMVAISIFFLVACDKDNYNESYSIFEKYKEELKKNGYELNKIDATNNVSGWLEIEDKDVIEIYRSKSEKQGVVYFYLFPSLKKANKWYEKIIASTQNTNYSVFQDGHYVIVVLGFDLTDLIANLNSNKA